MNLVAKIQEKPNVSRSERAIQVHAMVQVVKPTNNCMDLNCPFRRSLGWSRSPPQRTSAEASG